MHRCFRRKLCIAGRGGCQHDRTTRGMEALASRVSAVRKGKLSVCNSRTQFHRDVQALLLLRNFVGESNLAAHSLQLFQTCNCFALGGDPRFAANAASNDASPNSRLWWNGYSTLPC